VRYWNIGLSIIRKLSLKLLGMQIGSGTVIPKMFISWPHQVSIGNNCQLEHDIYFKYDGIYERGPSIIVKNDVFIGSGCEFNCNCKIEIGSYSNIASGCRFIDHDHGIDAAKLIGQQASIKGAIKLNNDVWLGFNVVILKGVEIGEGAIVGAGAVVTKSIPAYEIWAGVPAKKIGNRN
jgi:acetyltransferase-like isoleucine patch superfamily enzyme